VDPDEDYSVTQHELRRGSDQKSRIVKTIVSSGVQSKTITNRNQLKRFLQLYFADVPVEDMMGRSEPIMARVAIEHLTFGAIRRKGQALIRIFNPTKAQHGYESAYTFIEMVNDDMPFLVDSVSAVVKRLDMAVHITVHPVIPVRRNVRGRIEAIAKPGDKTAHLESFVRIAFDRETDPQKLKLLQREIRKVLTDVRFAVRDWQKMKLKMVETCGLLEFGPPGVDETLRKESQALLEWMVDERFTYLGYREYVLARRGKQVLLKPVPGSGLGLLTNGKRGDHTIELNREMQRLTRSKNWLILTKANSRSTVHRNAFLDYVGVKIYDRSGKVRGERRFIGLYTSVAYSDSPRNIPLLRHKVSRVLERAHVDPSGHRGKALLHIIDSFPRDELFQSSVQDLARTTVGVLNLQERQRVRFFLRRDTFRRFFACLVYIPREKYTTAVRTRVEDILKEAFDGTSIESSVQIANSELARVHIIVRTRHSERPRISIQKIEAQIAAVVVSWSDKLRSRLEEAFGADDGLKLFRLYGKIFPAGYQEDVSARKACRDVKCIDEMLGQSRVRSVKLYKPKNSSRDHLQFVVYSRDEPLTLSDALPVLEHMGVAVHTEHPYELELLNGESFWIQDFHLRYEIGAGLDIPKVASRFETCFTEVFEGRAENDGLNQLILSANLDCRQTNLLRCYTKYLMQLGLPFSQTYMENVLVAHPAFVQLLVDQFELQFDPSLGKSKRARQLSSAAPSIERAVARAKNVDEDRILTAFSGAVSATLRSNYFQPDERGDHKPYISIKLDPTQLPEVPLPRPKFEIFVYSPEVEGVHLRGGDIARGGIRWSDRREDFRTEVLGLMKAQVVKNTVIVPTGAKGGFFPKRLPDGDRETVQKSAIESYKTFIRGMLDITDNVVAGDVVPPNDVVCRDGDDPYLVVAADKGTATFSDIANGVSAEYNFWLDDAFASGGSAGYDHKKMGITACGAWEAVKRHFREQGINVQKTPFTVAGIGDMSGDVFGNGMLLSRKIKLVAALNHEHIFLDPDPDIRASYKERQRLFRKKRSTWQDYDETIISKGGGVYSRQAKTIRLSQEVRKLLDTSESSMQPDALVSAILRMRVDLLWNGGIGTYVKASTESHIDVGDRSNDNVRVSARRLRCKVIGEGGNLGLTQRARIEYSLAGGRINTDFIDNSAGVDCSDREVNIKILLSDVVKHKGMSSNKRNEFLAAMTDSVAKLVLRNNYLQAQSISMSEIRSVERIDEISRLIMNLERTGLLDRSLEFLPDDVEIEERRDRKQGFTRPEIAIVLSYAKIDLYNGLIASDETLEDFLIVDPQRYFPDMLRRRYLEFIPTHRLSRQILATLISNEIVNRMGPAFIQRIQGDTGANVVTIARAYTVARKICRGSNLLRTIESLDNEIPASAQVSMMFEVSRTLRHACYWLIERFGDDLDIESAVEHLRVGMAGVYTRTGSVLSTAARLRHQTSTDNHIEMGVPEKLANRMSELLLTRAALDIADLAAIHNRDVIETAKLYSAFNENLGIYWLHICAEELAVSGRWQSIARGDLREEFYRIRRELAAQLLCKRGKRDLARAAEKWLEEHSAQVTRYKGMVEEMKLRGDIDFAALTVAARELRAMISS